MAVFVSGDLVLIGPWVRALYALVVWNIVRSPDSPPSFSCLAALEPDRKESVIRVVVFMAVQADILEPMQRFFPAFSSTVHEMVDVFAGSATPLTLSLCPPDNLSA